MRLEVINFSFGWQDGLFSSVNCSLKAGEAVWLNGDNGSGKTTFLKCLCGMIPHFERGNVMAGEIKINGKSIIKNTPGHFFPEIATVDLFGLNLFLFTSNLDQESALLRSVVKHSADICEKRMERFESVFHLNRNWRSKFFLDMDVYEKTLALLLIFFLQQAQLYLFDETVKIIPQQQKKYWNDWLKILKEEGASAVIAAHEKPGPVDFRWVISERQLYVK